MDIIHLLNLVGTIDKMPWILASVAGMIAFLLHRAQNKGVIDFKEMFKDPDLKKTSLTRFASFVALVISSWGFIYLVVNGKLTEIYFTIYMTTWAGYNLVSKAIANKTTAKKEE